MYQSIYLPLVQRIKERITHRYNNPNRPKILNNEPDGIPLWSFPKVWFITGQNRPDILFFIFIYVFIFKSFFFDQFSFSSDPLRRRRPLGGRRQQQRSSGCWDGTETKAWIQWRGRRRRSRDGTLSRAQAGFNWESHGGQRRHHSHDLPSTWS